jgi:hypothetical protein
MATKRTRPKSARLIKEITRLCGDVGIVHGDVDELLIVRDHLACKLELLTTPVCTSPPTAMGKGIR